jgi:NAD(P)-dependent dehydrogenase (short-subunit alcohol dehydrogenase family)
LILVHAGGASGIGFAAAKILAERGASVHVLDLDQPSEDVSGVQYRHCNITKWDELRSAFEDVGHIDFVFANAGVTEEMDYFADTLDSAGRLAEPAYHVLDVNLRAVYNVVKLAWSRMRKDKTPGSIVITTSASGYAPEQSLPVYSSGKLAVGNFFHPAWPHTNSYVPG